MSNCVLLLDDEKLNKFKPLKHPESCERDEEIILNGEKPLVISVIF